MRDAINVTSVPDPVSLNGGIYYIRVEQFMETTSRDLQAGLNKVGEENIKGLILDLRGNPGWLGHMRVSPSRTNSLNKVRCDRVVSWPGSWCR